MTACSCSANDTPQIIPPWSWLSTMRGLMMRPAAKAPTTRGANLSEIGIDLDLGKHGAVRMHGVGRLGSCIGRAGAVTFDLREPGAAEDIGVALAAALVVATAQTAGARDDAGIARAEQRRAFVVQCKLGEAGDHVGTGIVDGNAGGGGMGRAARNIGIGKVGGAGA